MEKANQCVISARDLASNKRFIHALNLYMSAFFMMPAWKKQLMNEFLVILSEINEELTAVANDAAVLSNLQNAVTLFPDNINLINETGTCLYQQGYIAEALHYFETAIKLDNSQISIEKSLNNVKSFLFPRGQFRILNDVKRNSAYRAAIKSCVSVSDNVIDIDAGAGLLTLYASACNPKWIEGCEASSAMVELAQSVRLENGADNIVIVNRPSMALKYTNIAGRRCVLLTDSIDSGLIGENILQSVCDAWENFLNEDSKIIPGKAEYYVVGVKCDELYQKYNLCHAMKKILDVSHMDVRPSTLCGETYCSEDLHLYDNIKYMTAPTLLFTIDFNNHQEVHDMLHRQQPYNAELFAIEDGEINMVIGFFNLYLTDDIMLTSDPRSNSRAPGYQQAVFFDFQTKEVHKNECIELPFVIYDGKLTTVHDIKSPITRVSLESITYLNDTEYTNMIAKSVAAACIYLGQTLAIEEVDVVDLSPFPLFGVQMMRRGANSLICLAKTADDEAFLQTVLAANGIPKCKVNILVTEYWAMDVFKNKKFHVIFSHILDLNGDINVRRHWISDHLNNCHLIPGGICLPSSVTIMGQLISSKFLDTNNRLLDENVGYHMAKHVNRFKVSQAMCLEITRLDYEPLSDVFEVATCENLVSDVIKVPVLKDGNCNAILCWYKVQLLDNWYEIYTDRNNSFVQSMAYMTDADNCKVYSGNEASVVRCVDPTDLTYRLVLDVAAQ